MTLPKINDGIEFQVDVPSIKKKAKARPYLAKEEKELLFAAESKNPTVMFKAMVKTVNNCVDLPVKVDDLTMFDIENLFIQLRAISVGETTEIKMACEHCDHVNDDITVNLKDIKVDYRDTYTPTMDLTGKIKLQLGYPRIGDVLKSDLIDTMAGTDKTEFKAEHVFKFIRMSIRKVMADDEQFIFSTYSDKEQEDFVGQLNNAQLTELMKFMTDAPSSYLNFKFKCQNQACLKDNEVNVRGIQNFFS